MNIAQMLNELEVSLLGEVMNRLERHAEVQRQQEFFLRMLKPEEVREMLDALSDFEVFESILPLWTDDNSNYIALYVDGPLKYRICYLNHEETDNSPVFRSVGNFIRELEKDRQQDWEDLNKDYPSLASQADLEDLSIIQELVKQSERQQVDEDLRRQCLFSIMALIPQDLLPTILPLVEDEDPYVRERALATFKRHGMSAGKLKRELHVRGETGMGK